MKINDTQNRNGMNGTGMAFCRLVKNVDQLSSVTVWKTAINDYAKVSKVPTPNWISSLEYKPSSRAVRF